MRYYTYSSVRWGSEDLRPCIMYDPYNFVRSFTCDHLSFDVYCTNHASTFVRSTPIGVITGITESDIKLFTRKHSELFVSKIGTTFHNHIVWWQHVVHKVNRFSCRDCYFSRIKKQITIGSHLNIYSPLRCRKE